MTKGAFAYALNNLESTYISESLCYTERKENSQKRGTQALKIAAIAACFVIVFSGILSIAFNMLKAPGKIVVPPSQIGRELVIRPEESGKPTTGHKIGIRCFSFYSEKKICVDVFMSQWLSDREKETISGYPIFEVFETTENDLETGCVIINDNSGKYEKKFALEDLSFLTAASMEDDVFDGHSEKITLDFSSLKPGDTATIVFSYGFFYEKDNPYNQSQRDHSWCGMRRPLYFYCGENGISVSSNCMEDAISEYEKYSEQAIETGHNPTKDISCSAKDAYQSEQPDR